MIALIIIGAILLLIFGICAIRATVTLEYRDELTLAVSVLGIKIGILPKKEKKVDIKKYSAKRFRKLLEKRERDEEKKRRKKLQKEEKKKAKSCKRPKRMLPRSTKRKAALSARYSPSFQTCFPCSFRALPSIFASSSQGST